MSAIRLAQPSDFEDVLSLLIIRHAEAKSGRFNLTIVHQRFALMTSGGGGVVGVIDGGSGVEATIGLAIGQFWYTQDRHLEALWQIVHPDHRRSDHAKQLLGFARTEADRLGLPLVHSELETADTAPKVRLLERTFARLPLHVFRHEPANAS